MGDSFVSVSFRFVFFKISLIILFVLIRFIHKKHVHGHGKRQKQERRFKSIFFVSTYTGIICKKNRRRWTSVRSVAKTAYTLRSAATTQVSQGYVNRTKNKNQNGAPLTNLFFCKCSRYKFVPQKYKSKSRTKPMQKTPVFIHFGGSRSLPAAFFGLVRQVVQVAQAAGAVVHVGCAAGADQAVIQSAALSGLRVFAQFSSSGQGAFSGSAVRAVRQACAAGASVSWLAGGSLSLPLCARLSRRSQAALAGCAASVFFLATPGSRGSLSVAAHAAVAGQQVVAFSCGFSGPPVALSGQAGSWLPAQFAGHFCWQWQPAAAQLSLF